MTEPSVLSLASLQDAKVHYGSVACGASAEVA